MSIEFGGATAHAEDTWNGQDFRIGSTVVRIRGPVPRCAATTRHPDHGDADLKTLHLIRGYRHTTTTEPGQGIHFGVYADVITPGTIRTGDPLQPV
jgi:uncharacterized protein